MGAPLFAGACVLGIAGGVRVRYTARMPAVVQGMAAYAALMMYAMLVAGVVAALCFQRPEPRYMGAVVFGGLCVLLAALGCLVAGVLVPPPDWAAGVQVLLVAAGAFAAGCGWRRMLLSLGCLAFVTYMLWMGGRVLAGDSYLLLKEQMLPAAALPCLLALLLSVKSPVRFWGAFMGVFLVLYIMQFAGNAWEAHYPDSALPGEARLLREVVLGAAELLLLAWVFLGVLQAPRRRAACALALYALRAVYVVALLVRLP